MPCASSHHLNHEEVPSASSPTISPTPHPGSICASINTLLQQQSKSSNTSTELSLTNLYPQYHANPFHHREYTTPTKFIHISCSPRVCNIQGDSTTIHRTPDPNRKLVDSGANICITNDLDILVDITDVAPFSISVATEGDVADDSHCTKKGLLPVTLDNGKTIYVPCYYCPTVVDTIVSPEALIESHTAYAQWRQTGYKNPDTPGKLELMDAAGSVLGTLSLHRKNNLYYCVSHTFALEHDESRSTCYRTFAPVSKASQVESETWLLRLGSPGENQLQLLPRCSTGLPDKLECHPFRYNDSKEQASIKKQPASKHSERLPDCGDEFYMDFGFMRSSTSDYKHPNKSTDRVVLSYDGYTSYLIVVDGKSRRIWSFLTRTKEPPLHIIRAFLDKFGQQRGGLIRTDQGGELARSTEFRTVVEKEFGYIVEPTGADSPSQNGAAETYNGTLAIKARTLLYMSGLPAKFWSAALQHSVYLHNRLVHSVTKQTPFEVWHGTKPDLSHLKVFGSRVCVRQPGDRRSKLDRHDYTGIFLGYTATDKNILYLDTSSGIVKSSHHAVFDEAWYLQPKRPPAAQLLYDLGITAPDSIDDNQLTVDAQPTPTPTQAVSWPPQPPACVSKDKWSPPPQATMQPLPLQEFDRNSIAAQAATVSTPSKNPIPPTKLTGKELASELVTQYLIGHQDTATIYMSPCPYNDAFEEEIDLRKFDMSLHPTAGMCFFEKNGRIHLASMSPRTPGDKIPYWRTNIRGAWLIAINKQTVSSLEQAKQIFDEIRLSKAQFATLTFSHPEVSRDISNKGLPIISIDDFSQATLDQLNNRADIRYRKSYDVVESGQVLNYTTRVSRLTRGKLLKQQDWDDWHKSEYLQLDQYEEQGMFGNPTAVAADDAIFHLVWTYNIKAADGRKKARCVCDGSTRSGHVKILDETYANCVDQTSARLFYAVAAAENLLIYGADVTNAFAEAPPPKQGFYIRPDKAFIDWWTNHMKRPPIPPGHVIPINSAMQGHPESPRLWEKHADSILRDIGLKPTVHEPCLYSGIINNTRVILMRQVDDFAIASPDAHTAAILLDIIDEKLSIPLKRQGLIDMFNGIDITQTKHYIKIDCHSYIDKFCSKYQWLEKALITENRPTPLPTDPTWLKKFYAATGSTDTNDQAMLAKQMQINYRAGVGELIWAMTTCRPDIAFASVKLSQANSAPHEHHYHGLKHAIKYLYSTRDDGIYYWRTQPRDDLPEGRPPTINSNKADLLLNKRPQYDATTAVAYADSDWATCLKTRRSFTGACIFLAGAVIAYKAKFQSTVALSSTEAEFMAACDVGRMCLFIRSILWDLDIPQEAATIAYEDNNGCTAMGNAQKPTARTRHIDIRYYALCEWIERDLIRLERIDTAINTADHMTKPLTRTLFHRHADYLLGHVPPLYSPVYDSITKMYNDKYNIDQYVPTSFTTPTLAKVERILDTNT